MCAAGEHKALTPTAQWLLEASQTKVSEPKKVDGKAEAKASAKTKAKAAKPKAAKAKGQAKAKARSGFRTPYIFGHGAVSLVYVCVSHFRLLDAEPQLPNKEREKRLGLASR